MPSLGFRVRTIFTSFSETSFFFAVKYLYTGMTINANTMISIALGDNMFRNIAFALDNCEEELCGAISSNSLISWWDKPSKTDMLNIFLYPSGKLSIADIISSYGIDSLEVLPSSNTKLNSSSTSDKEMKSYLLPCSWYFNTRLVVILVSHWLNLWVFFKSFNETNASIKASWTRSSTTALSSLRILMHIPFILG